MTPRFPFVRNNDHLAVALALVFALFTIGLSLLPYKWHPILWNLTSIGALGVFAGGRLRPAFAIGLLLVVRIITDVTIHSFNSSYPIIYGETPFIFLGLGLYVVIGRWLCKGDSMIKIPAAGLLGSLQFFVVSNLGTWLVGLNFENVPYAKTWAGLMSCFELAIPYYRGTFLGDLFFTVAFFSVYVAALHVVKPAKVRVSS